MAEVQKGENNVEKPDGWGRAPGRAPGKGSIRHGCATYWKMPRRASAEGDQVPLCFWRQRSERDRNGMGRHETTGVRDNETVDSQWWVVGVCGCTVQVGFDGNDDVALERRLGRGNVEVVTFGESRLLGRFRHVHHWCGHHICDRGGGGGSGGILTNGHCKECGMCGC